MMPSLLLLFTLVLGLLLIPVILGLLLIPLIRDLLLIPLILSLLTILVVTPWFVVSPGQIAPLPMVTPVPVPVTPAPAWAAPGTFIPTSNPDDWSLKGIPPTETGR